MVSFNKNRVHVIITALAFNLRGMLRTLAHAVVAIGLGFRYILHGACLAFFPSLHPVVHFRIIKFTPFTLCICLLCFYRIVGGGIQKYRLIIEKTFKQSKLEN